MKGDKFAGCLNSVNHGDLLSCGLGANSFGGYCCYDGINNIDKSIKSLP